MCKRKLRKLTPRQQAILANKNSESRKVTQVDIQIEVAKNPLQIKDSKRTKKQLKLKMRDKKRAMSKRRKIMKGLSKIDRATELIEMYAGHKEIRRLRVGLQKLWPFETSAMYDDDIAEKRLAGLAEIVRNGTLQRSDVIDYLMLLARLTNEMTAGPNIVITEVYGPAPATTPNHDYEFSHSVEPLYVQKRIRSDDVKIDDITANKESGDSSVLYTAGWSTDGAFTKD
ncbi:hypothetical protein [Neptuniibacter halophilus]|uniref:hypothetical protein n=1 Tax=Neptuniibacter halophilus TaxID=651666 RepID=UPI0025735AB6|nr:hypothetical protein [Neptuniibacter halophilus]